MKYILNIITIILLFNTVAWCDTADPLDQNTWIVTPSSYENNMTVVAGLLIIDTDTSQNINNKIGAFVGDDCRGVASLEYIETFDAYMVSFFIYGSGTSEDIEFFVYNADADIVLPMDNIEPFVTNASFGTFANPYPFIATSFKLSFEKEDVLCEDDLGGSVVTSYVGGTPPYGISWSNGETTEDLEDLAVGWYYATATDGNGFSITDSIEIQNLATPIPEPNMTALPDPTVCKGSDAVVVAYADGFPDADFNWYDEGGNLLETGNTLVVPDFLEPATFFCETKIGECLSPLSSVALDIRDLGIDFSVEDNAVVEQEELVRFVVNNPNSDYEYYWTFGDNGWSTNESPYYYYNLPGDFNVSLTVTDLVNSCSQTITKEDYIVVLEPVFRFSQFEGLPDYSIGAFTYPNPFVNELTLVLKPTNVGEHRIGLYNTLGKEIKVWYHESDGSVEQISLDGLPSDLSIGTYVLFIESEGNRTSYKVFRQ